MRDWHGIKAAIGDQVFYVPADATGEPAIHQARPKRRTRRVLARTAASPSGDVTGNGQGTCWLHQPENVAVAKGARLCMTGGRKPCPTSPPRPAPPVVIFACGNLAHGHRRARGAA
jgi:hypothetical protein